MPGDAGGEAIEDESAEKAVLGVRDKVLDLAGCAGEDGGKTGALDVDVFPVLAAGVGDGLVLEGLAEAFGVVAVVGREGGGEGIAFGLEHEALFIVLTKGLVEGGGAGVGGDEEDAEGWCLGFVQVLLVIGGIINGKFLFVLDILPFVLFPKGLVDGLCNGAAKGKAAFACRGVTGDEEEEIGIVDEFVVLAADTGEAGGDDGKGAEKEKVGIFGGFVAGDDLLEKVRERVREGVGDGGTLRFLCSLHSLRGCCGGNGPTGARGVSL